MPASTQEEIGGDKKLSTSISIRVKAPPNALDRMSPSYEVAQRQNGVVVYRSSDYSDGDRNLLKSAGRDAVGRPMQRDLFDRWERVWHEGQYDLVPQCVQANYIRHDEASDRTVTREVYAAENAKTRLERPHLRIVVYDHTFEGDRAWFRFAFKWTDSKTGETRTRAGMQVYRIEAGKLAETWLMLQALGSAWTDAGAQEHWTSPPPVK